MARNIVCHHHCSNTLLCHNLTAITTTTMASTSAGLNLSGKLFFGGLSVGTFYLGCWQTQRYSQKISLMEERMKELALEPQAFTKKAQEESASFRRQLVRGQYIHDGEMLLGPRGPPPGALAVTGPASGRSEGGMSSGPQVRDRRS